MAYMGQDQKFVELTATLPAWRWRQILYAAEAHADARASAGFDYVSDAYREAAKDLAKQLDVEYSGDLPVRGVMG